MSKQHSGKKDENERRRVGIVNGVNPFKLKTQSIIIGGQ